MPTKDIKTDYGAVGDGQLQTLTVSFTAGQFTLTVFSNTFSSLDVNKKIAIENWIVADPSNPLGAIINTITAVGAFSGGSQTLTLSGDAAALSATSATKQVEWGTEDTGAFISFFTAFAGQTGVILTIPAGRYCMARRGLSTVIFQGILGLTVNGSGSPVITDMLGAGGYFLGSTLSILFNDNQAEARIQTISAGATTLHMVTVADAAKYSVNTWCWMTGFDTQGYGNPPNPYWAEYVFITAVDLVGGTVTIQSPLRNSYKSTWPNWVTGFPGTGAPNYTGGGFSLGGPATLYLIHQDWNATHVYNNVNFKLTPTLINVNCRDATFSGCTFEAFGPNCSQQINFTVDGATIPISWEIDKGTTNFFLSNSTIRGLNFFSAWPDNATLNNVTIQNDLNNSPKSFTAANCTFPTGVGFGPSSFGNGNSVNISNTSFAGQTVVGGVSESDLTGTGGYSMSGGIISRLKAGGTGAQPQWATPDHYFYIGSRFGFENTPLKVLDVWDNGTTLFIQTDQTGGFPPLVSPATTYSARTGQIRDFSFSNCTGCDDANSWSAVITGQPQFSQWHLTYSGNIGAANSVHQFNAVGKVISVKITVAAGYSAGTFNLNSPFVVTKPANTAVFWNPVIDLTTPGVRTITPSSTVSLGTDSGLALPNSGALRIPENQMTAAMSGVTGSGSVTLEILTDQGFTSSVVPLQLRLHA